VKITVRAGCTVIVREGIGTGFGRGQAPEVAHDIALKAAETDATKRALATFGNPFGLALYDKNHSQVTRPSNKSSTISKPVADEPAIEFVLSLGSGRLRRFGTSETFVEAVLNTLPRLETTDAVYAFWEANLESFTALHNYARTPGLDPVPMIVAALKARARAVGTVKAEHAPDKSPDEIKQTASISRLAFPKERRVRDADHLAFVKRHPCVVCGRRPTQAHHIRFAQPRAMSMKVSDEYTVPLCNGHHDSLHRTGDERAWWAARNIDPLSIAAGLWKSADKTQETKLDHGIDAVGSSQQDVTTSEQAPSTDQQGEAHHRGVDTT